jgi:hypothetical protein
MYECNADESQAGCAAPSIDRLSELLTGIDLVMMRAVSPLEQADLLFVAKFLRCRMTDNIDFFPTVKT